MPEFLGFPRADDTPSGGSLAMASIRTRNDSTVSIANVSTAVVHSRRLSAPDCVLPSDKEQQSIITRSARHTQPCSIGQVAKPSSKPHCARTNRKSNSTVEGAARLPPLSGPFPQPLVWASWRGQGWFGSEPARIRPHILSTGIAV